MTAVRDVIVLGLGAMGSAAAAELAVRGQDVLGIEQFTPAHDRGSSHGESRVIRQAYFEDPAYVPLLLRSYERFGDLERRTGRELLTITGGLFWGAADSEVVAGSLRSAREWDLAHEALDAGEIASRFPTMSPQPDDAGIHERNGGFVVPEATVSAQLEVAARAGAELRFEEPVISWDAADERVEVHTAAGTHRARQLVVAPGAWAPRMLASLGIDFEITRQALFWFHPLAGSERYALGSHPVYVHQGADGVQVYGFPGTEGTDGPAKVAFFRIGEPTTPETIERSVSEAETDRMRAAVRRFSPDLAGELDRAVTCLYENTPDQHFVISTHPDHPQVTVACGFSGHGFKFVPVVGEIVADLVVDGRTAHPIGLFDPARLTARDG